MRLLRYQGMYQSLTRDAVLKEFDYAFAENGLTAYKLGQELPTQSFIKFIGEDRYKTLVNFILHYVADLDIPIKRCAPGYSLIQSPCTTLLTLYTAQRHVR